MIDLMACLRKTKLIRQRDHAVMQFVGLLALLLLGMGSVAKAADEKRPNVLFILTDDQRFDAVSTEPTSVIATPQLERLARGGIVFSKHFCTTSLCSPSRASILTGLYASRHSVTNNFTEYPDSIETWPKALQRAGYRTAYFGKYHMGEENDDVRGGFDRFVTHRGQGKYFDTEFRFDGGERRVVPGYYTSVVTEMAESFMREQSSGGPWAMIVGHKAPHSFYVPEPKYEHAFDHVAFRYPPSAFELEDNDPWYRERLSTWHGIYGPLFDFRKQWPEVRPEGVKDFARMNRAYLGTILSVDDSVGHLLDVLEETGQLDHTIVVFTSDNGLLAGEHGMIDKRTAHEGSMRIPLIVRGPGLGQSSEVTRVERMTATVDFVPSLLELCGVPLESAVDGRSWAGLARGESAEGWRESLLYMYDYEKQFPYTPNVRAVRTERWKLIRYPHGDGGSDRRKADLFDLQSDPEERVNRIDDPELRETVVELEAELQRLLAEVGAMPDVMPLDEGIASELPEAGIR